MGLEGPGHVRGSDEKDGDATSARRRNEFLDGPVLEHEAQREHQHAQGPVDDRGRDISISEAFPEPAQKVHGPTVCDP